MSDDEQQEMTIERYEAMQPQASLEVDGKQIIYAVPNKIALMRVETLFQKEPATTNWIAGFNEDDVLLDIGANVGMYTILAAAGRGCRVFAFEPESQNFALLCRNILLNNLGERVMAWPAALSDSSKFDVIYLSEFVTGGSCHSFGEEVDFNLQSTKMAGAQGSISTTIDQLVNDKVIELPTHIKIDVDGFEHKVIAGARQTIARPELKSLLIEINPHLEEHKNLIAELLGHGFKFDAAQVAASARQSGAFKGFAEYVFRR